MTMLVRPVLFVLTIFAGLWAWGPAAAQGEPCPYGRKSLRSEYTESAYVLVARPQASRAQVAEGSRELALDISRVFKGKPPRPLEYSPPPGDPGFRMSAGNDYLLFVDVPESGPPVIDPCGNSRRLSGPGDPVLRELDPPPGSRRFDFIYDDRGRLAPTTLVAMIGALVGVLGFLLTLAARRSEQRWKRKEYVLRAFQERYDSPGAHNASFLLYWEDRHIPLWDDDEENRWTRVKDDEAAKAILPYCVHPYDFSRMKWLTAKRRIALNDSFVDLIWRLDHVRVVSKAAHPEDVREIIHELGEILEESPEARRTAPTGRLVTSAFKLMLAWRGMDDLVLFFDDYGYNVRYRLRDHLRLTRAFPHCAWRKLPWRTVSALQPPRRRRLRTGPLGFLQRVWRAMGPVRRPRVRRPSGTLMRKPA